MIDRYSKIIKNVFEYADVGQEEVRELSTDWDGALLEIDFKTDWMSYICYIDFSAAVRGFYSEPLPI